MMFLYFTLLVIVLKAGQSVYLAEDSVFGMGKQYNLFGIALLAFFLFFKMIDAMQNYSPPPRNDKSKTDDSKNI